MVIKNVNVLVGDGNIINNASNADGKLSCGNNSARGFIDCNHFVAGRIDFGKKTD